MQKDKSKKGCSFFLWSNSYSPHQRVLRKFPPLHSKTLMFPVWLFQFLSPFPLRSTMVRILDPHHWSHKSKFLESPWTKVIRTLFDLAAVDSVNAFPLQILPFCYLLRHSKLLVFSQFKEYSFLAVFVIFSSFVPHPPSFSHTHPNVGLFLKAALFHLWLQSLSDILQSHLPSICCYRLLRPV